MYNLIKQCNSGWKLTPLTRDEGFVEKWNSLYSPSWLAPLPLWVFLSSVKGVTSTCCVTHISLYGNQSRRGGGVFPKKMWWRRIRLSLGPFSLRCEIGKTKLPNFRQDWMCMLYMQKTAAQTFCKTVLHFCIAPAFTLRPNVAVPVTSCDAWLVMRFRLSFLIFLLKEQLKLFTFTLSLSPWTLFFFCLF